MGFNPSLANATTLGGVTPTAAGLAILYDEDAAAQRTTLGVVANTVYDAVGTGTVYTLTATPAAVAFGTTSPSITLTVAGVYRLKMRCNVKFNAATFAAAKNVICKLRRTNNTAADITNGSVTLIAGIITALTSSLGEMSIEVPYTTALTNDVITIFGSVESLPGAGSVDVVEASISAVRIG
jgi:hypothetical protein